MIILPMEKHIHAHVYLSETHRSARVIYRRPWRCSCFASAADKIHVVHNVEEGTETDLKHYKFQASACVEYVLLATHYPKSTRYHLEPCLGVPGSLWRLLGASPVGIAQIPRTCASWGEKPNQGLRVHFFHSLSTTKKTLED